MQSHVLCSSSARHGKPRPAATSACCHPVNGKTWSQSAITGLSWKFRDYCLNKCRDPDQIWMDLFHRPFRCRPFFSIAWWSILLNISLKRSHNPWHYGWFGLVVQTPQRVTWTFNAHFHHFSCLVDEQQRTGSAYKLRLMMRRPNRKYISRVAAAQRGGGYLMSIISLLVNAEGLPKPKNATSVQWWRLETWSIGQRTSL